MGSLYIVATPIGNLQDISFRAIDVLRGADVIACEDTRRTGLFLQHIEKTYFPDIPLEERKKPTLLSYYEQSEAARIPQIISFLKNNYNVALVSDAGTPTISDPGFKLVRECIKEGIKVESIPGPSSVISSLVSSGLPTDKFLFIGYLPKKEGNTKKLLEGVKVAVDVVKSTVVIFEAPHRLLKTFERIEKVFGDIQLVTARELTKVHEEVKRGKISNLKEHFLKTAPKGEFVILFNLGEQI